MAINSKIARQYREQYPKMPTLTLARVMYNENAEVFKDVEAARYSLRHIEGKVGQLRKAQLKDKTFVLEDPRPYNPFKLPESEEVTFEPHRITGVTKLGILSDIHIPYHSIQALTAALQHLKKSQVDGILLNGDTIDFYGLSRFMKDPRKRSVSHELKAVNEFLDILQKQFPKAKIIYKLGNHDIRYEHFLMHKAPELLGIAEFEFKNLLKLQSRGIELVGDKRIMKANKLNIIHGHEFGGSVFSPVNIARGLFLKGKVSAIQGHNHQVSEHTEPNMDGEITTTWSLGCLSELHPEYLPINKWSHGVATVELDGNGIDYEVSNRRIYKGKLL
jgi:predicted phosphodiesterase